MKFIYFYRQSVIGVGVEEEDKKHTWMEDADAVRYPIIYHIRPKKINNMFLRHFFLENDAGGRLFIFDFFNAKKRCI